MGKSYRNLKQTLLAFLDRRVSWAAEKFVKTESSVTLVKTSQSRAQTEMHALALPCKEETAYIWKQAKFKFCCHLQVAISRLEWQWAE